MLSVDLSSAIDCVYKVEGKGEPLILIHGIGAARDAWRFLPPVLEQHFTVVTYDLRGHGESPLHFGEFGLDELVIDLEKLRQTLGYEKVHLAGVNELKEPRKWFLTFYNEKYLPFHISILKQLFHFIILCLAMYEFTIVFISHHSLLS